MRLVEAKSLARRLRPVAETIPYLTRGIAVAAKRCALRLFAPGDYDEHRFRLAKPREIVEITVETVGKVRVAVTHEFRRRRNDRHATPHLCRKPRPAVYVSARICACFHTADYKSPSQNER